MYREQRDRGNSKQQQQNKWISNGFINVDPVAEVEWRKNSIHDIQNDFQLVNCLQNDVLFMTAFLFMGFCFHSANVSLVWENAKTFRNRWNKTTHAYNGLISGKRLFFRIFDVFARCSDIVWHAHKNAHKMLIICKGVFLLFWSLDIFFHSV